MAIQGIVQGVGFRPFVYRLAHEMGLAGWVNNSSQGVLVEAEGPSSALEQFARRLREEAPAHAAIHTMEMRWLDPAGYATFEVVASDTSGAKSAVVLPDLATCPDCLSEIRDPNDRRYRYPFTNCTHCGPRFTILEAVPYDRPNTSMRRFEMCPACLREYEDPADRRFHAQPNACPVCGPHLELWDADGNARETHDAALVAAVEALRAGAVVAVKGLGGFHLMVDARNEQAVAALRERKRREEKPFAVMAPDLAWVRSACMLEEAEERLLTSAESPIVLLTRRAGVPDAVAPSVVPAAGKGRYPNPSLGVMLPYTPLHHLLLADFGAPVIATSGNLIDEPICTDEREALVRLEGIADLFLVHNRPIVRHVDDSVVRVMLGRELVLRRARGYAPLPVRLKEPGPAVMALGAHQKCAVCLAVDDRACISQHIGDLETAQAYEALQRVEADLRGLAGVSPETIACDMHPDYLSTRFAERIAPPSGPYRVQHHHAHVLSCMAENELEGAVLGVAWDGTGYGPDGTVWGGEFLVVEGARFRRFAHLRGFRLPGAEKAVREPSRCAVGLLYEVHGDLLFDKKRLPCLMAHTLRERRLLRRLLMTGLNSPWTTSAGRLFDGVASLLGLRHAVRHEGQAAMELEYAAASAKGEGTLPFRLHTDHEPFVIDWTPAIEELMAALAAREPVHELASRFHNMLADAIVAVAACAGQERVALTGGCFQNRVLTERAVARLRAAGFTPYWHQRVPPNDGGIALGQAMAVRAVRNTK